MVTQISTIQELQDIQNNLSDDYVLTDDIDGTGFDFTPLGSSSNRFNGTFDGDGHTIENLTINATDNVGMFRYVENGTLENVNLVNFDITGNEAGTLVCHSHGTSTIQEVYVVDSTVEATSAGAGGLMDSQLDNTVIRDTAVVRTDVTGDTVESGFVATTAFGTQEIRNCYTANNTLSGTADTIAEVVGDVGFESTDELTFEDTYYDTDEASYTDYNLVAGSVSGTVTGLTTSEMQGSSAETNMAFDFTNTWTTQDADYPIQQRFVPLVRVAQTFTNTVSSDGFRVGNIIRTAVGWTGQVYTSTTRGLAESRLSQTFTNPIETDATLASIGRLAQSFSNPVSTVSTPGVTARSYVSSVLSESNSYDVIANISARMGMARHGTSQHGFGRPTLVREAISYIQDVATEADRDLLLDRLSETWTGANRSDSTRSLALDRAVSTFVNPIQSVASRSTKSARDAINYVGQVATNTGIGAMLAETFTNPIDTESSSNFGLGRIAETFTGTISTDTDRTTVFERVVSTFTEPFSTDGERRLHLIRAGQTYLGLVVSKTNIAVHAISHVGPIQTSTTRLRGIYRTGVGYVGEVWTDSESFLDNIQIVKPLTAVVESTKRLLSVGETKHEVNTEDTTKTVETEEGTKKVHVRKSSTSVNVTNEEDP